MERSKKPEVRPKGPVSKVPVSRPDLKKRVIDFGDTEFESSLTPALDNNPLARLGFDASTAKIVGSDDVGFGPWENAHWVPAEWTKDEAKFDTLNHQRRATLKTKSHIEPDDVVNSTWSASSPDVWAHEFAHRGLYRLYEYQQEDPEYFIKKYGKDFSDWIRIYGWKSDEATIEASDDPSAEWIDDKGTKQYLYNTITRSMSKPSIEILDKVDQAANDLLKLRGDVPKTKPNYPGDSRSWLGKLFNKSKYAEGGAVSSMDEQMEMAFMRENDVDPVSGNEVPPGSTAKEVRDDIEINVSEGEYVVPADVVQYFGLKYFEDARKKAKDALAQMDEDGRIGGDPMEDDEDDLPFSDEELEVESDEDVEIGMAIGGMVAASSGSESRQYTNDVGNIITVLFMDGEPVQPIPPGYRPMSSSGQGVMRTNNESRRAERNAAAPITEEDERRNIDPSQWDINDFERFSKQGKALGALTSATSLLGPGAMLVGGLINMANKATTNKALEELETRLADPNINKNDLPKLTELRDKLLKSTESRQESGGLINKLLGGESNLLDFFNRDKKDDKAPAFKTSRFAAKAVSPASSGNSTPARRKPRKLDENGNIQYRAGGLVTRRK